MQKFFSIYLDLVRFLAAMGVFIGHMMNHSITGHVIWWRLGEYGMLCVTIFFVLSGYVIAYVTSERENTGKSYFVSRISRLYSVTILALVVTYLFDHFGQSFDPELYEVGKKNAVLWKPISLTGYLSTLFFINEFQFFEFNGVVPGTNGPFWSLSFEAAYYLIAGLLLFLPKIRAIPLVIIILLFGGNTIMALLPTWGFGFLLYKISAKGESSSQKKSKIIKTLALILFCLSALALISFRYIVEIDILPVLNFGLDFKWGVLPWNKNNILIDYMIAMIFGLHLIAARQLPSIMSSALLMAEKPIRWLGAITFPLYCIHAPALGFFKSISPWETESLANTIFIGASTLVLVAVFTPACDWLKHFIRKRLALVI